MLIWRKNYPRVVYQPVVAIHGVFYVVKDEVVFKHRLCEWVVNAETARHFRYNPRNLPVVIRTVDTVDHGLRAAISRTVNGYVHEEVHITNLPINSYD